MKTGSIRDEFGHTPTVQTRSSHDSRRTGLRLKGIRFLDGALKKLIGLQA